MDKWVMGIFIIVLFTLLGFFTVYSETIQIQNTNNSLLTAPFCSTTYLISRSGLNYSAKNCQTGLFDFGTSSNFGSCTGTNASCVIQSTINKLKPVCGSIQLTPATFNITKGLTLFPCINLIGTGANGCCINSNLPSANNTVILSMVDMTHPIITITDDSNRPTSKYFPNLAYISLIGNNASNAPLQDGVNITQHNGAVQDTFLDHVVCFFVGGNCFEMDPSSTGKFLMDESYCENSVLNCFFIHSGQIRITNTYIFSAGKWGINMSASQYIQVLNDFIVSNTLGGVNCFTASDGCQINNNLIKDNGGGLNPQIKGQTITRPFIISHNAFRDDRAGAARAINHILLNTGLSQVVIDGNGFTGSSGLAINQTTDSGIAYIRNNPGFNPFGKIATPFQFSSTITPAGLGGTVANIHISSTITIHDVDMQIVCTGGTGAALAEEDQNGNIIQNLTSPLFFQFVPIGFKVVSNGWSVAPTCTFYGN